MTGGAERTGSGLVMEARGLAKRFQSGPKTIDVLSGVSLEVAAGSTVSIQGESGSGKSTLLNLLAGIEKTDSGEVYWNGQALSGRAEAELTTERGRFLGFVFQAFYLVPELTVLENVVLAVRVVGGKKAEGLERARDLLGVLGLGGREQSAVAELSGGERQRVAIARALVNRPQVVLADEPTGNLDERTAERVMEELLGICADRSTALLLVTHNGEFAARAERRFYLEGGRLG